MLSSLAIRLPRCRRDVQTVLRPGFDGSCRRRVRRLASRDERLSRQRLHHPAARIIRAAPEWAPGVRAVFDGAQDQRCAAARTAALRVVVESGVQVPDVLPMGCSRWRQPVGEVFLDCLLDLQFRQHGRAEGLDTRDVATPKQHVRGAFGLELTVAREDDYRVDHCVRRWSKALSAWTYLKFCRSGFLNR